MTRILAAVLAAALVSTAPASAQSPAPALPTGPTLAPAVSSTPTPEVYTPLACAILVKRANVDKKPISARTVGALTEAALRAHDFDALLAATIKAQQAAAKAKAAHDPLAGAAGAAAAETIKVASASFYRAQADVRACFGLR